MMRTIGELLDHALESYADLPAVRWLKKKEVLERSYRELGEDISAVRNGLAEEGFHRDHIALIGTSSVEWVTAYFAVTTGENVAVPLDAGLPAEDLLELLNRAHAKALFLSPKNKSLAEQVRVSCPEIRKIWFLTEEDDTDMETIQDVKAAGEGKEQQSEHYASTIAEAIDKQSCRDSHQEVAHIGGNLYERRLGDRDVHLVLEVLVEHIQDGTGKSPKKEECGNQYERHHVVGAVRPK